MKQHHENFEFEVRPIKKIVTFECTELPEKKFLERIGLIVRSRQPISVYWADGVIFVPSPYQPKSDVVVKEALEGTVYWSSVIFASMLKHQPSLKFGAFTVPVIDQTSNPTLRKVAKSLKKTRAKLKVQSIDRSIDREKRGETLERNEG